MALDDDLLTDPTVPNSTGSSVDTGLIYDRTKEDVGKNEKGFLNKSDIFRITWWATRAKERAEELGYNIKFFQLLAIQTNMDSIFTSYNLECLIKSITSIRDGIIEKDFLLEFPEWRPLYMSDTIDYNSLNDMEWDLQIILNYPYPPEQIYHSSGYLYSGEDQEFAILL